MRGRVFEDLIRGRAPRLPQTLFRLTLAVPALLFAALTRLRAYAFARGWLASARIPRPVISIGNLSVGGTGKTPFVRFVCRELLEMGARPLVIGRGYGARAPGSHLDEEGASLAADLPRVRVSQGPDRVAVAQRALAEDPSLDVVVLDDAAQTLRVQRDLDVWLLDAQDPFTGGWTLPAGALREPPAALARADLCVLTRTGRAGVERTRHSKQRVARRARSGTPVLEADHGNSSRPPTAPHCGSATDSTHLGNRAVWLVAGIAEPSSFLRQAEALEADVRGQSWFRDHHPFSPEDLQRVRHQARGAKADLIVCTGKDWPKLSALSSPGELPELVALETDIHMPPASRATLREALLRLTGGGPPA